MILVIAEQREGKLNRASWEAVAAAQQLAAKAGQPPIKVAVAGGQPGASAGELAAAAVDGGHRARGAGPRPVHRGRRSQPPSRTWLPRRRPRYVVFPHTYQARDFVPKLAARLAACAHHRRRRDHRGTGTAGVHAPGVPGQACRRRRARGRGTVPRHRAGRRLPGRRGGARRLAGAGHDGRGRRGCCRHPPEAGGAVPRGEAGGGPVAGRAHRRRGPRHQGAGQARRLPSSWPRRSTPNSPRRGRSATPAGCRSSGRSAAPARRWRRSSTWRSASPAPFSTRSA